jgi:hypothetical protein
MEQSPSKIPSHQIILIAATALVSPKSVKKYFSGEPLRDMTRARIERTLGEMKLNHDGTKAEVGT